MSILGSLLKIGGIAAAPFTGGASLIPTALSAAGDIGSVLGGQQGGKNNAMAAQANLQSQHDRNAVDLFQAQQQAQNQAGALDLQRKGFEQSSRGTNAKQALIGALLGGGLTPTTISGGHASGGLLESLNGNPEALAAMKMLSHQAGAAQSTPMQFQGGQMLTAPQLSAMPKMDTGGGFLGTLAKIGELAGAASPYVQGPGQKAQVPDLAYQAGLDPRFLMPGQKVELG
jgi:hypothetical protein